MDWGDLFAGVDGEIDDIVALAVRLLRFCRDNAAAIVKALDQAEVRRALNQIGVEASTLFDDIGDEILDTDDRARCVEFARRWEPLVPPAIVARGMAAGLDHALGHRFMGFISGRARLHEVEADGPIPVATPPLKAIFANRLNSNPDNFGDQLDALPRLRLAPAVLEPYVVRLCFEHRDALEVLSAGVRVGAGIPNSGTAALDWDRHTRADQAMFFRVRPRDAREQERILRKILNHAARLGVRLLVLPELCLDEGTIKALRTPMANTRMVIVAGSYHVERDVLGRRNESVMVLPNGGVLTHRKFNRFDFEDRDDLGNLPTVRRVEDIETTPATITIAYSARWSYSLLICKDLVEPRVSALLAEMRVRVVLVPACSPKSDVFETRARQLATDAQAVVVIANMCDEIEETASVIVALPVKGDSLRAVRRGDLKPPQLVTFELNKEGYLQIA